MQHLVFLLPKKIQVASLPTKKKVSIYIITCTRIQALFQKIFLPILQIQVFQEALASPLDEALFVLLPSMHVQDSLRQLMDHLNDEHYQEYQSQGKEEQKTCAMQILRLHFGNPKKWENIATVVEKAKNIVYERPPRYYVLLWERVTKLSGNSFVVKTTAKCYEPLQKTLTTRSIAFRRKKSLVLLHVVKLHCT